MDEYDSYQHNNEEQALYMFTCPYCLMAYDSQKDAYQCCDINQHPDLNE